MSVYVDDMRAPYRRMIMCHMIADTHEELIAMAGAIGVAPHWIQKEGRHDEHFDICLSMRKKAVALGAKEISWHDLGEMLQRRRVEQQWARVLE